MAKLGDICEILDNKRVPITASDRKSGIYPYYGANGVQDYVDDYIFDNELVLLAEDGGYFGSLDRPIAYRVSGKCWVNNHAHVLKPKKAVNVDYLCYSLMFRDISNIVNGATRQKLTQADMRQIDIPLCSMKEQQTIVGILNNVFSLLSLRKQQLAKLDELVKARFVEMFGDPVTNPHNWDKKLLKELAEIKIGPFGTLLHKEDYIPNAHALVNPSHIIDDKIQVDLKLTVSDDKYNELSAYHLNIDDVILGRRGEMGRCAVVSENGLLCGTGSMIIRSNGRLKADYIQKIISFPSFKKTIENMAVGQTMPNLNVPIVSNFLIICPPLEVQEQYYAFAAKVEKTKSTIKQSLETLKTLKAALMQKYFG